ncbi:MAG: O-antigen ligase family protein [Planctomycetes bacterium]|nr:O-antigen ligase family protein [Planctomycetota bacterium]
MTGFAANLTLSAPVRETSAKAGPLLWSLVGLLLLVPLPLGCAAPEHRGLWLAAGGVLVVVLAMGRSHPPRALLWLGTVLVVPVLQLALPGSGPNHVLTSVPARTWLRGAEWLALWAVALWAGCHGSRPAQVRQGLLALVCASSLFVVHGLLLQRGAVGLLSAEQTTTVMVGTFVNRNHFANLLALAMVLGVGLFGALQQRRAAPALRLWVAAAIAVGGLGVLASESRGALVASAVGVALCLWLAQPRTLRQHLALAAILVLLASITALLLPASVWARFAQLGVELQGGGSRLDIWRGAVALWRQFPWFGTGLGTFGDLSPATQSALVPGRIENVHNDPLELLVESGVVGAALVTLLLGTFAVRALRQILALRPGERRWLASGCAAAVAAFAVHAGAEFPLAIPANATWAAACLGLLAGLLAPTHAVTAPSQRPAAPASGLLRLALGVGGGLLCGFGLDRAWHHEQRDGLADLRAGHQALATAPDQAADHAAAALAKSPFSPGAHRLAAAAAARCGDLAAARPHLAASLHWTNAADRDARHIDLAIDCLQHGASELAAELLAAVLPRLPETARRTALARMHDALPFAEALSALLPDDAPSRATLAEVLLQRSDFAGREHVLAARTGSAPARLTLRDGAQLVATEVDVSRSDEGGTTATVRLQFAGTGMPQRVPLVLRCEGPDAAIFRSFDADDRGFVYVARFDSAFPPGDYRLALDFRADAPHFPFGHVSLPAAELHLTATPVPATRLYWSTTPPGRRIHPDDGLPLRVGDRVWRDARLPAGARDLVARTRTPTRLMAHFAGQRLDPALDVPTTVHRFALPAAEAGRFELSAAGADEPLLLDVAVLQRSGR